LTGRTTLLYHDTQDNNFQRGMRLTHVLLTAVNIIRGMRACVRARALLSTHTHTHTHTRARAHEHTSVSVARIAHI